MGQLKPIYLGFGIVSTTALPRRVMELFSVAADHFALDTEIAVMSLVIVDPAISSQHHVSSPHAPRRASSGAKPRDVENALETCTRFIALELEAMSVEKLQ